MKTSEMIALLQQQIAEHGDLPFVICVDDAGEDTANYYSMPHSLMVLKLHHPPYRGRAGEPHIAICGSSE